MSKYEDIDPRIAEACEAMDELHADLTSPSKIPEVDPIIFRDYFLPLFTGLVGDERPVITEWIKTVGSATTEAQVRAPNGEMVTIPPIMDTSVLKTSNELDVRTLSDTYASAMERMSVLPGSALRDMDNILNDKVEVGEVQNSEDQWLKILDVFGMIPEDSKLIGSSDNEEEDSVFDFE